jgi:hypothetical protein
VKGFASPDSTDIQTWVDFQHVDEGRVPGTNKSFTI